MPCMCCWGVLGLVVVCVVGVLSMLVSFQTRRQDLLCTGVCLRFQCVLCSLCLSGNAYTSISYNLVHCFCGVPDILTITLSNIRSHNNSS